MSDLGQSLRAARIRAGLTQKELSDRIGVNGATISYWERDLNAVSDYAVKRIAKVCDMSVEDIRAGSVPEPDLPELKEYQKEQLRAIALRQIRRPRAHVVDQDAFIRYLLDALTAAAAEYMKCLNKPKEGDEE